MMTYQNNNQQRFKALNSTSAICNALSAILDRPFIKIIRFIKELGRGKCPWLHYELPDGRRLATFISPKAFQGYWWNNDFSETINRATGAKYLLSDSHCSCQSWEYHVQTGKRKTCKHQRMSQLEILRHKFPVVNLSDSLPSILPQSKPPRLQVISKPKPQPTDTEVTARSNKIDLSSLKEGLTLERTSDRTLIEYYLKAWHKNTPLS